MTLLQIVPDDPSDQAVAMPMAGITARERGDLSALVRKREKVAKTAAKQRAAELMADVEAQLAQTFKAEDERWAVVMTETKAAADRTNQEIRRVCREHGIPQEFAPSLYTHWLERGENRFASRRSELRKVAATRIAAMELAARSAIEQGSLEAQTALLAGGLTTDAARAVLAALPTVEVLMPGLSVAELEAALPIGAGRSR